MPNLSPSPILSRNLHRGIGGGRVRRGKRRHGERTQREWWAGQRSSSRSASDPWAASCLWTSPYSSSLSDFLGTRQKLLVPWDPISDLKPSGLCGARLCIWCGNLRLVVFIWGPSASVSYWQLPSESEKFAFLLENLWETGKITPLTLCHNLFYFILFFFLKVVGV